MDQVNKMQKYFYMKEMNREWAIAVIVLAFMNMAVCLLPCIYLQYIAIDLVQYLMNYSVFGAQVVMGAWIVGSFFIGWWFAESLLQPYVTIPLLLMIRRSR